MGRRESGGEECKERDAGAGETGHFGKREKSEPLFYSTPWHSASAACIPLMPPPALYLTAPLGLSESLLVVLLLPVPRLLPLEAPGRVSPEALLFASGVGRVAREVLSIC